MQFMNVNAGSATKKAPGAFEFQQPRFSSASFMNNRHLSMQSDKPDEFGAGLQSNVMFPPTGPNSGQLFDQMFAQGGSRHKMSLDYSGPPKGGDKGL